MFRHSFFALALVTLNAGCGSSEPDVAATTDAAVDAPVDTGKVDTGKVDTGTAEVAPLPGCETELPSSFMCTAPTKTAGKTTCTDAALLDMVEKCLKADITVPSTCTEWKTANPACASCVADWSWDAKPGKIYPDDYKCYWSTFDAPCAKSVNCLYACQEEVCAECGDEEVNDCYDDARKTGGRCYTIAGKEAATCFSTFDAKLAGCDVSEIYADSPSLTTLKEEILRFYRGACRDNADWTNATMAAGDAGTDTGAVDAPAETSVVTDAADGG